MSRVVDGRGTGDRRDPADRLMEASRDVAAARKILKGAEELMLAEAAVYLAGRSGDSFEEDLRPDGHLQAPPYGSSNKIPVGMTLVLSYEPHGSHGTRG